MRTSLIEIKQIENLLLKQGDIQERLITEAKILLSPELKEKLNWQLKSYELIRQYGLEKLSQEIKEVEDYVFTNPKYGSFQSRIRSIFKY